MASISSPALWNLLNLPAVKDVYYPKYSSTRPFYEQYRSPTGGYGGLLSVTFRARAEAIAFYDALDTAKGPSLGTNFTLRLVNSEDERRHLSNTT